jgi:chromosomal replication initiation ATPase DnaA
MKLFAYSHTTAGIARLQRERQPTLATIEPVEVERVLARQPEPVNNVVQMIPRTKVQQIIADIAKKHGLTYADLMRRTLARKIVAARDEAMATVKAAKPELSNSQLGRMFTGMKRPGVIAALRRHAKRAGK